MDATSFIHASTLAAPKFVSSTATALEIDDTLNTLATNYLNVIDKQMFSSSSVSPFQYLHLMVNSSNITVAANISKTCDTLTGLVTPLSLPSLKISSIALWQLATPCMDNYPYVVTFEGSPQLWAIHPPVKKSDTHRLFTNVAANIALESKQVALPLCFYYPLKYPLEPPKDCAAYACLVGNISTYLAEHEQKIPIIEFASKGKELAQQELKLCNETLDEMQDVHCQNLEMILEALSQAASIGCTSVTFTEDEFADFEQTLNLAEPQMTKFQERGLIISNAAPMSSQEPKKSTKSITPLLITCIIFFGVSWALFQVPQARQRIKFLLKKS